MGGVFLQKGAGGNAESCVRSLKASQEKVECDEPREVAPEGPCELREVIRMCSTWRGTVPLATL